MKRWIFLFALFFVVFVFASGYGEPRDVGRTESLELLMRAEGFVLGMEGEGFSVFFEKDTLLDAKRYFIGNDLDSLDQIISFEEDQDKRIYLQGLILIGQETPSYELRERDYFMTAKLADNVVKRKDQAYELLDSIALFEEREAEERGNGIDTNDALGIFGRVPEAYGAGRYDEVEGILDEANLKLDEAVSEAQKINTAIRATQGFFVKYWWQIILALAIIASVAIPVSNEIIRRLREKRLAMLKTKLVLNRELLRSAQEGCFNAKVITVETYRIREKKYKEDRVKIENKIKILEKILGISKKGDYGSGKGRGLVVKA